MHWGILPLNETRGRRAEQALTAAFVRTIRKAGKYHDGGGLGLYLRVEDNGARQWVQRMTIHGKRRELGLGAPPFVSLLQAREKAIDNKRLVRAGDDPLQTKKQARAIMNFEAAARTVHAMHLPTWRSKKHAMQFLATLETYTFPRLGSRKVSDISTSDVLAVLQPIWLEKPETARRVRQRIGMVLTYAIARGWRTDNPAANISRVLPRHGNTKQHRKALHYSQVAPCIDVVHASGAWLATKLAFEFAVLTVARSGAVRLAPWSEIDMANRVWTIPPGRELSKIPKDGKAHRVPLSDRAMTILREAEQLRDVSAFIFPSVQGGSLSDMTLSKLIKELGFDADMHGFRTSFRTWAQEQTNFSPELAEAGMAHVNKDKVEAAYARSDLFDKRREMLSDWATFLATSKRVFGET